MPGSDAPEMKQWFDRIDKFKRDWFPKFEDLLGSMCLGSEQSPIRIHHRVTENTEKAPRLVQTTTLPIGFSEIHALHNLPKAWIGAHGIEHGIDVGKWCEEESLLGGLLEPVQRRLIITESHFRSADLEGEYPGMSFLSVY